MNVICINSIEQTKNRVREILEKNNYSTNEIVVLEIVDAINLISDYREEGITLFPEIIFAHNALDFRSLPIQFIKLSDDTIKSNIFKKILKFCAPLAVDNWQIYVIIKDDLQIEYGLISAEIKETSLSLYTQIVDLSTEQSELIYLRNIGKKRIEISDGREQTIISLSLNIVEGNYDNNEKCLVEDILSRVESPILELLKGFVLKSIFEILRVGHGNLIVVCEKENLSQILSQMSGGITLEKPIDILDYVKTDNQENSNISSVNIKTHLSLIRSMVNHDGISIFSTQCELLAFHYIVNNNVTSKENVVGGARTKAFEALKTLAGVKSCFFKSQDGQTKFYRKNE